MSHNPNNKLCHQRFFSHRNGYCCCTCPEKIDDTPKQDWEEEWEQFSGYITNISVAQYNEAGVNVGFLQAKDVIKDFIRKKIAEARKEGYTAGLKKAKEIAQKTVFGVEGRITFEEAINKEIDV